MLLSQPQPKTLVNFQSLIDERLAQAGPEILKSVELNLGKNPDLVTQHFRKLYIETCARYIQCKLILHRLRRQGDFLNPWTSLRDKARMEMFDLEQKLTELEAGHVIRSSRSEADRIAQRHHKNNHIPIW